MQEKVYSINIRMYFDSEDGMNELKKHLEYFSCPRNPSIERFLKNSAINFTKQDTSVTYLVFSKEDNLLVGYFSVAVRPVQIPAEKVSKTIARRLERAGRFDPEANIYNVAAYLIAQLGKNYTDGLNERVTGEDLLYAAWGLLQKIQYEVGGSIVFVEAENYQGLLNFYSRNVFQVFGERHNDNEDLIQLIRVIKQ